MAKLLRTLRLPLLTFYGTGMILGAGIYSVIGKAAGVAGSSLWMSFLLAAVAVSLTALSYAELSSMLPKSGAEYIFLKTAFPKTHWLALSVGLMVIFSGASTAATVTIAFSGYLSEFVQIPVVLMAFLLVLFFTIVNIVGIQLSSGLNVVFTLIEASGLVLLIYWGVQEPKLTESLGATPTLNTVSAAALVVFAFFGFENITNLTEDAKDPTKNIPRAIFLSLGISTVLYLLVSFSVLALMDPQALSSSSAPLADAVKKVSPFSAKALGVIALFATANTALIALLTTSRFLYRMSKEKALPLMFSKISVKTHSPWVASIAIGIVACVLLPLGNVETIASVSSLSALISFFGVNLALIVLRYKAKSKTRPFRVPLSIGKFPVLPLLGAILSFVFIFQFDKLVYIIGFSFLAVSMLIARLAKL